MDKWRRWGLTEAEWIDCVAAARELAELSDGNERTASAEEIAAQLAVAKAAEERLPIDESEPLWRVPLRR